MEKEHKKDGEGTSWGRMRVGQGLKNWGGGVGGRQEELQFNNHHWWCFHGGVGKLNL